MARNVIAGKSKALAGLSELQKKLNDLATSLSSADKAKAKQSIYDVVRSAGNVLKDEATANARAVGVPESVVSTLFTSANPIHDEPFKARALVGVNKRRSMIQWTAGRRPKSPRAKVAPGGKVAMSRAAMYELGTSRQPATPFFRPAVSSARRRIIDTLSTGVQNILKAYTKGQQ